MSTTTRHQTISENWRLYLESLDNRIDERSVYKFTGTPSDPDNPDSRWDPKTIKKTFVSRDPDAPIEGLKGTKEAWLEKVKHVLIAAGFSVAAIAARWALFKVLKFVGWVGSVGKSLLGRGAAALSRALGIGGGLFGTIGRGLGMFFGITAGAAVVTAVGMACYKVYKLMNPDIAKATENPAGPGTDKFVDSIEKGKNSLGMRSWRKASDTETGRRLQCRWCKANPGQEFPTVKNRKGTWVKAKEVERAIFFKDLFTSEEEINKPKVYKDATEKSKIPKELEKAYYDIKENGPFCKDILKRDACKNASAIKKPSGGTSAVTLSSNPLEGQVSEIKIPGQAGAIQHNLTGERKQMAEAYFNKMVELGITNKYVLAGLLATSGKESNFVGKAEGARYGFERLKAGKKAGGNTAVSNRVRKVFMHQLGREPTEKEWWQLSKENGHKGGVALFNIAYGYEPVKKNGKRWYTTYQQEKAIPHTKRVITKDGVINPDLYDENLAGYKYRGRGAIQLTFKATYAAAAKAAKLSPEMQEKVIEKPDLLITDPMIGVLMNAGASKMSYNKTSRNMERSLSAGNPDNLLDGIRFGCLLAGGGGGSTTASWFNYAVSRAVQVATKHIRVVAGTPSV